MSHEIRTPMNAVVGFTELLQATELDDMQRDYVNTVADSGKTLLTLINDILDISKIEAGEVQLEHISFDVRYLVENVIKIISFKTKKSAVGIHYSIEETIPRYLQGDPTRIRQILLNLLGNAVKFTEEGEIILAVTGAAMPGHNDSKIYEIRFSVKDTGIGIAPAKQEIIFHAFTQADSSTTRKYGGTGLGLTISKALVERMGGTIDVQSEEGKGSEFIVTLTLDGGMQPKPDKIPENLSHILEHKNVWIVEPEQKIRRCLEMYCTAAGMHVLASVPSLAGSRQWLQTQTELPDVVLIDISTEPEGAFACIQELKMNQSYASIKIIALERNGSPGSATRSKKHACDAYLSKPFTREELLDVMQFAYSGIHPAGQIITRHMAQEHKLEGSRILVVEDNVVNLKLIRVLLEKMGCRVDDAFNGKEALAKLKVGSYDIVLMDVQMPEMGGIEATEAIRHELKQTIPIIALTAAAMKDDEEKVRTAGMNDYLIKPVEVRLLREKLCFWLNKGTGPGLVT